ncbi:MAG: glycosyltransferase family 2 protein [Candidatus Aureabacteria bacterium]|jgi:glycosyltransferase involved in cell wall biosynthesis|nr:glycosyltransferase family 2 protein [Candidatus Auribacterota bacterium]NLW94734.1 glycosyltransferase family 2 protein [Chlamydiota bacterium]HOE26515.1 glycosyltransferase family 2 protein [bacterium]HQM52180.1 glycosyltransferase family 2 protein [bacterium]
MTASAMPPVSALLLVHNEAEVIEEVVRDIHREVLAKLPGSELVIAEDGSTDGTKEILARIVPGLPGARLVQGTERKGYTRAYKDALRACRNDLIFFSDSSGKHDAADFWRLAALIGEVDMVIGCKADRRDPFYRVAMSRVFNLLVSRYFGHRFRDINSGFRLMRREAIAPVLEEEWRMKHLINFEFTLRALGHGARIAEVPVRHSRRKHGPSRGLPLKKIPEAISMALRAFPALKREIGGAKRP